MPSTSGRTPQVRPLPRRKERRPSRPSRGYARFELGPTVPSRRESPAGPPTLAEDPSRRPLGSPSQSRGMLGWLVVFIAKTRCGRCSAMCWGRWAEKTVAFRFLREIPGPRPHPPQPQAGPRAGRDEENHLDLAGVRAGSWTDIGTTEHTIYVVLEIPKSPVAAADMAATISNSPGWTLWKSVRLGLRRHTRMKRLKNPTGRQPVPNVKLHPMTMFSVQLLQPDRLPQRPRQSHQFL